MTEQKTVDNKPNAMPRQGKGPMGGGKANMMKGAKPKNSKLAIKKLLAYMKPFLPIIIFALFLAVGATAISLIGPNLISDLTDEITKGLGLMAVGNMSGIDLDAVGKIGLTLVLMYSSSVLFNYIQGFIMTTVSQKLTKKMRTELSEKINRMPLKYFDSTNHGDVMSRVTNDVDTIGQTLSQSVVSLVTAIILFVGSAVMMFVTNWIMAFSAIGATILSFGLMSVIMMKSQKYFMAQQIQIGKLNGHIEEVYSGHNVVKVYNGETKAKETFSKINSELRSNAHKSQFMSGLMMPLMGFVGNLAFVTICIVGAVLVRNGTITFGVITAFMIYIRLFTNPLSQIAQSMSMLQPTIAAGERVFEFLEEKELDDEKNKTARLSNVRGDVEFKNVHFGYTQDKTIINDFSAQAKPGKKIAIVGPTGAGKTTIVNLLMRFYETGSGQILIDGIDTKDVTRENVREQFCMVLQDTWLFEGTVRENIVFNTKNVTDEQLVAACKAAGVDHYIRTLPEGYDTVLSDNANLSAGQRQLMTIARAMLENSPMLILDEATSSVDTRTEILIQKAMDKLMSGRTSFVIAHRLSTIKNSDLILVLKDGDIVEQGNHDELLSQNGFYASLYNSQFETE